MDPIEPKLELPRLLDPILVPKVPVLEGGPNELELFAGKPVVGPEELGVLGAARLVILTSAGCAVRLGCAVTRGPATPYDSDNSTYTPLASALLSLARDSANAPSNEPTKHALLVVAAFIAFSLRQLSSDEGSYHQAFGEPWVDGAS